MSIWKIGPRRVANASRLTSSDSSHRSPPLWKKPRRLKTVVAFRSGDQKFLYPPKKRPPTSFSFVWIKEFKNQKIHEDERGFTVSLRSLAIQITICLERRKNAHAHSRIETTNCKFSFTTSTWFSTAFPICGLCVSFSNTNSWAHQKIATTKRPSWQNSRLNWLGLHEMFSPIPMYPGFCGGSPPWDIPVPKESTWRFLLGDRLTWKMVVRQPIKHGCTSGV